MESLLHRFEPGMLIGVIIPLAGMILAAYIVYLALEFRHRRTEKLMETVQRLADRGQPIPPYLLDPPQANRASPFFSAMTLVGVGIGLALMFWSMNLGKIVGVGLMIMCIGIAQLIALGIEARRRERQGAERPSPQDFGGPPDGLPPFGGPGSAPPGAR